MINYPLEFDIQAQGKSGIQTVWSSGAAHGVSAKCAIPPEFAGPGGGFSPEDLYAMAIGNCFIATFKVIAEKSNFIFDEILVHAHLTVDRNEAGFPWMAKVHNHVILKGGSDVDRGKRLLEKTSKQCLVGNSVRTPITYEFELRS